MVSAPRAIKGGRGQRRRRTKTEMAAICDAIYEVLLNDNPQGVRHVFYCLCEHPYYLVPKTEAGYQVIKRKLLDLRKLGRVPWTWVSDGTRWSLQSQSFDSQAEAERFFA